MKPTAEELEILKTYAQISHTEDEYVWLRADEKGTYIEYAFKDGVPHDNRCLSWYYSFQPNARKRNAMAFGHSEEEAEREVEMWKNEVEKKIDNLFTLHSFSCGYEENPEEALKESEESWNKYIDLHDNEPFVKEHHICKVGCPASICVKNKTCSHWTYEEPVKCACWNLSEINGLPKAVSISMEDAMRLKDELIK